MANIEASPMDSSGLWTIRLQNTRRCRFPSEIDSMTFARIRDSVSAAPSCVGWMHELRFLLCAVGGQEAGGRARARFQKRDDMGKDDGHDSVSLGPRRHGCGDTVCAHAHDQDNAAEGRAALGPLCLVPWRVGTRLDGISRWMRVHSKPAPSGWRLDWLQRIKRRARRVWTGQACRLLPLFRQLLPLPLLSPHTHARCTHILSFHSTTRERRRKGQPGFFGTRVHCTHSLLFALSEAARYSLGTTYPTLPTASQPPKLSSRSGKSSHRPHTFTRTLHNLLPRCTALHHRPRPHATVCAALGVVMIHDDEAPLTMFYPSIARATLASTRHT